MALSGGAPVGLTGAHASRAPGTYVWWCNPASGPLRASPSACSSPRTAWRPWKQHRGQRSEAFFPSQWKRKKLCYFCCCMNTDARRHRLNKDSDKSVRRSRGEKTLSLEAQIKKAFSSWVTASRELQGKLGASRGWRLHPRPVNRPKPLYRNGKKFSDKLKILSLSLRMLTINWFSINCWFHWLN